MSRDHAPSMCLLHGAFHTMAPDCWRLAADWYFRHADLDDDTGRAIYQAAVEAHMLDQLRHDRTLPESENPTTVDPTTCPTPGCTFPKKASQYLCPGCWYTLQPAARRALSRRDDLAVRRLAELREQLRQDTALRQVVITP
ncbi:hypothetical protein [Actinoallomurus sp. CA-142502]|uniref:hypothetical protein n=1 Tax=Actinoallomurus sp. CA-142502 TaxID=3239885 RepID=UPI003D91613E